MGPLQLRREVVREALQLMEQKDKVRSIQLQELRNRVDEGLAQSERGEGVDVEYSCGEFLKTSMRVSQNAKRDERIHPDAGCPRESRGPERRPSGSLNIH